MTKFSRLDRLPPYVFATVDELKMKARRAGEDIIDLGMGNPDLGTIGAGYLEARSGSSLAALPVTRKSDLMDRQAATPPFGGLAAVAGNGQSQGSGPLLKALASKVVGDVNPQSLDQVQPTLRYAYEKGNLTFTRDDAEVVWQWVDYLPKLMS